MRLNIKQMATRVLMFGLLFGSTVEGASLATSDKQTSRIETALLAAPKTTWIAQGQGRHVVYVIFDPNCGYCQLLYKNLQTFMTPNELQLRWIPVAILDATSLGKAVVIMQANDPKTALDYNEAHYNTTTYTGGISEEIPSAITEKRLRANAALLNQVGIPVVPTMLFQAKSGEAMVIQGALSPIALRKVLDRLQ
jgi:thiol:disulfide interchange protein DsbG